VKDTDDLQGLITRTEEDEVTTLGCEAATGEEFLANSVAAWIDTKGFDARPELAKISFLHFLAPLFQCVGTDGSQILQSGLGEDQLHAWFRTRSMKCCSELTSIV